MNLSFDDYILDIAKEVSDALGDTLDLSTIRWVSEPSSKGPVSDATLAFLIDSSAGAKDVALLVSNPHFPKTVGEDTTKAALIRSSLDENARNHVATPIYQGEFKGQSFAAFERYSPASSRRVVRYLQKRAVVPEIVSWSISVAKQTQNRNLEQFDERFVAPLEWLANDEASTSKTRHNALKSLEYISSSQQDRVWTSAEHGDFWLGNILFDGSKSTRILGVSKAFKIIDWRGSKLDGYPCADVLRLLKSTFKPGSGTARNLFERYQADLGISDSEATIYTLLSLAELGRNLDQFPRANFNALCDETIQFLEAMGKAEPTG